MIGIFSALNSFSTDILQAQTSQLLMSYYEITSHNFRYIVSYKVACLSLRLIPVMLFWMLPSQEEIQGMSEAKSPRQANSRLVLAEKDQIDISKPVLNSPEVLLEQL